MDKMTKKEVFDKYAKYYIGRNMIRKHAHNVYYRSGKEKCCKVCGYSKYVDVCHVKDVKDFDGDALISEINHIDNLVALCKNHHVEFDNNLMEKEDLEKIYVRV